MMQILCIILFLAYLGWTGILWSKILGSVFSLKEKYIRTVLGIFASIIFLSLIASVFVVWYKINWIVTTFLYIVGAVVPFWLCKKTKSLEIEEAPESEIFGFFPKRKFLLFCFFALASLEVAILYLCQTGSALTTPWQTVHPWYLYNFFLLAFLLGVLLLSRISFRVKFFLLVIFSFCLHMYLPLAHTNPWGGDVWRMIAVEQKLVSGEPELPMLPHALWNPYKYTYGQLWGIMTLFHKVTGISLVELHRWFVPIIWSVILPIFGFLFGKLFFSENKKALFVSSLCAFPFALQAIGSITVSVSFGFLTFLFSVFLWSTYVQEQKPWQKHIALLFGVLMIFGYALFAILFWLVVLLSFVFKKYRQKKWVLALFTVFALLLIPGIDVFLKFSFFSEQFSVITFFKQLFGQFSGWYFARPISSVEIASANIFFNHIPKDSYVENIFSSFRFLLVPMMFLVSISWLSGIYALWKKENNVVIRILSLVFFALFGGYIVGWYILSGDRVFVRRLDSVLAFFGMLFALYGIFHFPFLQYFSSLSFRKKYIYFFLSLVYISFCSTTILATGPDVRVVSSDEYKTAEYIFSQQKDLPCVLSDTWTLLALEAVSSGRIVGGGFPVTNNFGQVERLRLYNELLKNPDVRIVPEISKVLPVQTCFIAMSREEIDIRIEERLHEFLGDLVFKSGPMLVWKMDLKKF